MRKIIFHVIISCLIMFTGCSNKPVIENNIPVDEEVVEEKTEVIEAVYTIDNKVKTINGYTSYIIRHFDINGNTVEVEKITVDFVRYKDRMFYDVEQAKKYDIIKDYYIIKGEMYFQLKIGAKLVLESFIKAEQETKNSLLLSVSPDKEINKKIVEYGVIIEHDKGGVLRPTFMKTVRQ